MAHLEDQLNALFGSDEEDEGLQQDEHDDEQAKGNGSVNVDIDSAADKLGTVPPILKHSEDDETKESHAKSDTAAKTQDQLNALFGDDSDENVSIAAAEEKERYEDAAALEEKEDEQDEEEEEPESDLVKRKRKLKDLVEESRSKDKVDDEDELNEARRVAIANARKAKVVEKVVAKGEPSANVAAIPDAFPPQTPLFLVRLPNVVGIDTEIFDPEIWSAKENARREAEEAKRNEEEQSHDKMNDNAPTKKAVELMVENVIRWRENVDSNGHRFRESNARFVEWSNGSMQLMVGSEVFDVIRRNFDNNHYLMTKLDSRAEKVLKENADISDLRVHLESEKQPSLLRRQSGRINGMIQFKVTGIESATHRNLKSVIAQTHTKAAKIQMYFPQSDPEKLREEAERMERENRRKRDRIERKQYREKASAYSRNNAVDFLEEELGDDSYRSIRRGRLMDEEASGRRLASIQQEEEEVDDEMADFIADDEEVEYEQPVRRHRTESSGPRGNTTVSAAAAVPSPDEFIPEEDEDFSLTRQSKRRRVLGDDDED